MNEHADKVRHERLRRGWSVRQAAASGKISNTYWGNFEDYKQPLTPTIAEAVALAFGWPEEWAGEPVETTASPLADRVDRLERRLVQLGRVVREELGVELDAFDSPPTQLPPDDGEALPPSQESHP